MKDLLIFGTGGFARELHQLVEDINVVMPAWNMLGFLDGDAAKIGSQVHGLTVFGGVDYLEHMCERPVYVAIGIGNPAVRRKVVAAVTAHGARFATLVHPRAWVGNRITIGQGSVICAGVLATTDIAIGAHVIVNIGTTIGHDTIIEDYVTIAPTVNVSGSIVVGEGADLGTGCTIIQGKNIGAWSIIGAGSVVVKDIAADVTAVGAPAQAIKARRAGWHLD